MGYELRDRGIFNFQFSIFKEGLGGVRGDDGIQNSEFRIQNCCCQWPVVSGQSPLF